MSKKNNGIQNAEEIIEQFGGIRPMAKKLDVAVTTIQGWKKRGKIPASRRSTIINAAAKHDIDIDALLGQKPVANTQQKQSSPVASDVKTQTENKPPAKPVKMDTPMNADKNEQPETPVLTKQKTKTHATDTSTESFDEKLAQLERNAVTKSTWITLLLLFLALVAAFFLLFPHTDSAVEKTRLSAIEQDVNQLQNEVQDVKTNQSFLKTVIPEDLDARIQKLQKQAETAVDGANTALDKAEQLSREMVSAASTGDLSQRLNSLENKINDLRGSPELNDLMNRMQLMTNSLNGQQQLEHATQDILTALRSYNNTPVLAEEGTEQPNNINMALDAARNQSAVLAGTFENIPQDDLKAAALLLSMTQFRQSLNRDNVAFADDLEVIKNLVGDDNPELIASIDALAPHAQNGVLTPKGLSDELKSVSGEIIVDSLQGKDVSIKDKLTARLNKFVKVEKDGELITGTDTQAVLTKSEYLMEQGDIEGAITNIQMLEDTHGDLVKPWINKAKATLNARKVETTVKRAVAKITRPSGENAPLYVTP